jgi:hypothetical protein
VVTSFEEPSYWIKSGFVKFALIPELNLALIDAFHVIYVSVCTTSVFDVTEIIEKILGNVKYVVVLLP